MSDTKESNPPIKEKAKEKIENVRKEAGHAAVDRSGEFSEFKKEIVALAKEKLNGLQENFESLSNEVEKAAQSAFQKTKVQSKKIEKDIKKHPVRWTGRALAVLGAIAGIFILGKRKKPSNPE